MKFKITAEVEGERLLQQVYFMMEEAGLSNIIFSAEGVTELEIRDQPPREAGEMFLAKYLLENGPHHRLALKDAFEASGRRRNSFYGAFDWLKNSGCVIVEIQTDLVILTSLGKRKAEEGLTASQLRTVS